MKFYTLWIFFASLCFLVSCKPKASTTSDGLYHGKEALSWLSKNENEFALASNHFDSSKFAIAFVKRLYELGADSVLIPDSCIYSEDSRIKSEGGPYANCLTVLFPNEKAKWASLLAECRKELDPESQEIDLAQEIRDRKLFLWWD